MKKVLKIFLSLLLPLLVAGLVLGLKEMGRKQEVRKKAVGEKAVLTLVAPASVEAGSDFFVDVFLNPSGLEVSAASVSASFPTDKLLLKEITAGPFFKDAFDANPSQMEMLKLGISCSVDTDCRPDFPEPTTQANRDYMNAIKCEASAETNNLKICRNVLTKTPILVSPTAGLARATVILGAPCPRTDLTPLPTQTRCITTTGSTLMKFATFKFQALAAAPSGAAAITFDMANTQVAAIGHSADEDIVDRTQQSSVSVNIVGSSIDTILNFSLRFQGITAQGPSKNVTVKIKGTAVEQTVSLTSNVQGVYSNPTPVNFGQLTSGTNYEILIRGNNTLWKKFSGITLNPGTNTAPSSWTGTGQELKVGDVTGDNYLKMDDVTGIISAWIQSETSVTAATEKYDLNSDSNIAMSDVTAIISNWIQSEVPGDE